MAKKKKSRKQLLNQPDEFLSFSGKMFQYALEYRKQLLWAAGGLIALALVIVALQYWSERTEKRAFNLLEGTLRQYETAMRDEGRAAAFDAAEEDFQALLEKYGNRNAGKLARVIFANICYQTDRPERAIELYEEALDDFRSHPFYCNLILTSLGYAHTQKQNLKRAIAYFRQVAEGAESPLKDEALFNLGQLYAQLGDHAMSTAAYEKLVSDFPESMYLELAKEKLAG